jgi:putative DNA primase/helicase
VDLARSDPAITILPSQLDVDPWLLNCLNGTIDLKTGELRPHLREDFITRVCPVNYDPDAGFLLWDEFLERTHPNAEMRGFMRRAGGYTITGLSTEEKLFFCHGDANTGKSTFLQALNATLGGYSPAPGYSATADFDTFLAKDRNSGHTADIARLAGARMVISVEVEEGKKLAEGLVKHITGGEIITASHKYQSSFEYMPSFQLWLAANQRPVVRADDNAMWRRILQIPFEVVIPEAERDPGIKATLIDPEVAGPAILAWLVRGCLEWQHMGLAPPGKVQEATAKYREEMDPIAEYLEDRCVIQAGAEADNNDLYQDYLKWAGAAGVRRPLGRKTFTQVLKSRGFEQARENKKRYWPGIGLLAPDSLLDEMET